MNVIVGGLLLAATAQAHYNWPKLIVGSTTDSAIWTHVRQAKNYQSNGFVADVTSIDIRCNQMGVKASTATVAAGGQLGFVTNQAIYHAGPVQFYMAKVPAGSTADSWDGAGEVWFKTMTSMPTSGLTVWPSDSKSSFTFTVPKSLPDGEYLVRAEHIGLHSAKISGGAQFYIACGQVTVTGGGSGTPGPLVAFPGAYKATDPGIMIDIYNSKGTTYTPPGPAVWKG